MNRRTDLKKVLVTGSEGFIGTHLMNVLRTNPNIEMTGIDLKLGHDIRLKQDWGDFDAVYHLAARSDAHSTDIEADFQTNVVATFKLMQRYGRRLVFASSSMVNYPVNSYAVSKLTGERYARLFGSRVVRLCNIYGPGGHSVIDKFREATDQITIYGDGHQLRTYAPVADAVTALTYDNRPFYILQGTEMRVWQLADLIVSSTVKRHYAPMKVTDVIDARQLPY